MSKRLHSVFFIIFPEIACNFGGKYLNLHHIFKIGNIFFRKVMYLCRQIKIFSSNKYNLKSATCNIFDI